MFKTTIIGQYGETNVFSEDYLVCSIVSAIFARDFGYVTLRAFTMQRFLAYIAIFFFDQAVDAIDFGKYILVTIFYYYH